MTPEFISQFLTEAEAAHLKRGLRGIVPVSPRECRYRNKTCLNFSSNNYLGLADHPKLKAESISWTERYGSGSGASRLVTGTIDAYLELEQEIATWKGSEAALIAGSGFLANLGAIAALADRNTVIFADKLNHASLNAGCQLSGAKLVRYRHNDFGHLQSRLEQFRNTNRKLIVSDTIFSMDGDIAQPGPLEEIAKQHNAILLLDDAHATGVFGKNGEGLACSNRDGLNMGTFSKAMGSYGACLTGSRDMIDYLVNKCAPFIYSTAPPPGVFGAISAAVRLVQTPEFGKKRSRLREISDYLRNELRELGFDTGGSASQIIPVILGDSGKVLKASEFLLDRGIMAVAIRPPTVPEGTARIRLSLSAAHTSADLERLIEAFRDLSGSS